MKAHYGTGYSRGRWAVVDFLSQKDVATGEVVFTAGECARAMKISIPTARKWLEYYVKFSGGWLLRTEHPYRRNNIARIYRVNPKA